MKNTEKKPQKSLFRTILQKGGLICAGIICALLLLELSLWIAAFRYRLRQEMPPLNNSAHLVILCIGESTTAGTGADSYPSQLEQILTARLNRPVQVINAGQAGTNSERISVQLPALLKKYRPDLVLAMMGINGGYVDDTVCADTWSVQSLLQNTSSVKSINFIRLLTHAIRVRYYGKRLPAAPEATRPAEPDIQTSSRPAAREARWLQSADTLLQQGNQKQAQRIITEIENHYSGTDERIFIQLGKLNDLMNNRSAAERHFRAAAAAAPEDPFVWTSLGNFLLVNRFPKQEVEDCYRNALKLSPQSIYPYRLLTNLYKNNGNYTEMEELIADFSLRYGHPDPDFQLSVAYSLLKRRQYSAARNKLEEMLTSDILSPSDQEGVYRGMVSCCIAAHDFKSADRYQHQAEELVLRYFKKTLRTDYLRCHNSTQSAGIPLVCVQYPNRSIAPLRRLFSQSDHVYFIENKDVFRRALRQGNITDIFTDLFAGDFGHCTAAGNHMLSSHVADQLEKIFSLNIKTASER